MRRTRKRPNHLGFTLIEIMAVAAIIGLTTAMSLPHFLSLRVGANEAAAQVNLKSLYTLIEDYRFANGTYPTQPSEITSFVNAYYKKHSIISNPDPSGNSWKFQGYQYKYVVDTSGQWQWTATPDVPKVTGKRLFTMNAGGELSASNPSNESSAKTSGPGAAPPPAEDF